MPVQVRNVLMLGFVVFALGEHTGKRMKRTGWPLRRGILTQPPCLGGRGRIRGKDSVPLFISRKLGRIISVQFVGLGSQNYDFWYEL